VGLMSTVCANSRSDYALPSSAGTTSVVVPFYLDDAPESGPWPPDTDNIMSFIGVKNLSATPVTVTVRYWDVFGDDWVDYSDPLGNTRELGAYSTVSWRPVADDDREGVGKAWPNVTPDMPRQTGSAVITASGPIVGRLTAICANSQSAYDLQSE